MELTKKKGSRRNFLSKRGVKIPEILTSDELKTKATNLGLQVSRLRTKGELEKAIKKAEEERRFQRPIPAPRTKRRVPPVPAPRRLKETKSLMGEPVPEMTAQILVPQTIPLRPPRTKALKRGAKQTIETFSGWFDWLKDTGKAFVTKVNSKPEDLKDKIKGFWETVSVVESASAFRRFARQFSFTGPGGDPRSFFRKITKEVMEVLNIKKRNEISYSLPNEKNCYDNWRSHF